MKAEVRDAILTIAVTYFNKFARDLYLPALPILVTLFVTDEKTIQYSVALFFIALFLARLFWPVLLERFSLRTVTSWNLGIFISATLISLAHIELTTFLVVRFIQGFCVGALPAILRGYVYHRHKSKKTIQVLAYTSIFTAWGPSIALLIGGYCLLWFGWQAITIALLISAILCWALLFVYCKDTQPITKQFSLIHYTAAIKLCQDRHFLRYTLPFAFLSAGFAAYLTLSPFLFIDYLGFTPTEYAHLSFVLFAGLLVGKLSAGKLVDFVTEDTIILTGVLLCTAASLALLSLDYLPALHVTILFISCLALYLVGYGMIMPVCKTTVMTNGNGNAYSSTAMLGVVAGLFSAIASSLVAHYATTNITTLASLMIFMSIISISTFKIPTSSQKMNQSKY